MLGVFYVQRKDMPSDGTVCRTFPTGGTGRLPGKPEQNAVPTKGDTMGMARAGNGFSPPATGHYIFSVHTAVPSKGAAGFFYSTHFYLFPKQITKRYIISITGVPEIFQVRFFCAFGYGFFRPFRCRAPPFQS